MRSWNFDVDSTSKFRHWKSGKTVRIVRSLFRYRFQQFYIGRWKTAKKRWKSTLTIWLCSLWICLGHKLFVLWPSFSMSLSTLMHCNFHQQHLIRTLRMTNIYSTFALFGHHSICFVFIVLSILMENKIKGLRWMIPPMVVHPEKIDFRRFV